MAQTASDPDAFACFYDRYELAIVGYFASRVGDVDRAADLTAEVFASALVGAARYRQGGPTAAAWLFTIAHNTLLKSVRRGRVEASARARLGMSARLDLCEASRGRIESAVASDEWVSELLAGLPADQRDAVSAHVLDDRSYREIAADNQTSEAVIRKRVSRGLAALRRDLRRSA
ncbi:MAG TPA: RNA polymerase sigma factor [Solirubrobacteraceae bacterium]